MGVVNQGFLKIEAYYLLILHIRLFGEFLRSQPAQQTLVGLPDWLGGGFSLVFREAFLLLYISPEMKIFFPVK